MLRLKSLRIDKLRKVQPGTILNFTGDKNLVLGKNGVGKTTLLEVIACAAKLEFSAFENEEIDVTVGLSGEGAASLNAVNIDARFRHIKTAAEASLVDSIQEDAATFLALFIDVSVVHGASTFKIEVAHGKISITENSEPVVVFDSGPYFVVMFEAVNRLTSLLFEAQRTGLANTFSSILKLLLGRKALARLDESLDVVQRTMAEPVQLKLRDSNFVTINRPTVDDLRRALVDKANADSEQLSATSEVVEFLRLFAKLVGADLVKTIFNRKSRVEHYDSLILTFHNQNFSIQHGQSVTYFDQFSYGQKRLLAILQYLASNEEVVVADEITNGLHHEWIYFIVKKLEGRQCFLTSQNPVLLDFLTFTSAAETQNRLIRCEHGPNGTLIWRNLTEQEANDFYTSYETGMQHVGEIMLKQGLW
ncbi:MAG TPA: AAA family ATPase [Kofleriaceae bacterium]|nr:AAA family ATPase [Kofleriaceae bacterium]